jgi:hypothetical protein
LFADWHEDNIKSRAEGYEPGSHGAHPGD